MEIDKILDVVGRITAAATLFDSYEVEYIGDDFSLTVRAVSKEQEEE